MNYSLFVRPNEGDAWSAALDPGPFVDLRGVTSEPFERDGQPAGIDLSLDPADPAPQARLDAIFAACADGDLTLFDPQLGRVVTAADVDAIAEQMRQLQAFSDAAPLSLDTTGPQASPMRWFWIAVAGLFVLMIVLDRAAGCLL